MHKVIVECRSCNTHSAFLTNRGTGYWVHHNANLLHPGQEEGAQVPEYVELICSRDYLLLGRPTPGYPSPIFPQPHVIHLLFFRFVLWDNHQIACIVGAWNVWTFFVSRAGIRWGCKSVMQTVGSEEIRMQFCPEGCSARCYLCIMLLLMWGCDFQVLWLSTCHSEKTFRI